MHALKAALDRLITPTLRDEQDLGRFVRRLTLGCVAAAVAIVATAIATLLGSWDTAANALPITALVAAFVAYPVIHVLGNAQLELYRAMSAVSELSLRDPLTGVGNRRALLDRVAFIGAEPFILVVADIDRFKSVNDRHGHAAGDTVIAETATRMAEELGDLGLVCRTGGEEFALLAAAADPSVIRKRLLAFQRRIADAPMRHGDTDLAVTVSLGVASNLEGRGFAETYAAADRALYVAKASGRDAIVFDLDLESRLEPPLPPDEIGWSGDLVSWGEGTEAVPARPPQPDAA